MSASLKLPHPMTVEEFYNWDADDGLAYQLVDGEPQAMAPGSVRHGILQSEVGRLIGNNLRNQGSHCWVVTTPGVIPRLLPGHNFRIPDLGITCSEQDLGRPALSDPVLLIEILSPSNRAETWSNVRAYTSIPSVHEILVLHSRTVAAEVLRRARDGTWPEEPEMIVTGDLVLESIGFRVALADLYSPTGLKS